MRRGNKVNSEGKVSEASAPTFSQSQQSLRFTGDIETDAAILASCLKLHVLREVLTETVLHPQDSTTKPLTQPA